VADELRVTLSTARAHLQSVFEKTGTHRQAELVRMLIELATANMPDRLESAAE
jgi:DNA-binding CsgD family transcriptional regulator